MHEQDGGFARTAGIGGDVFANAHRPCGARRGKVARLADVGRHDLRLEQRAGVFLARLVGGESP